MSRARSPERLQNVLLHTPHLEIEVLVVPDGVLAHHAHQVVETELANHRIGHPPELPVAVHLLMELRPHDGRWAVVGCRRIRDLVDYTAHRTHHHMSDPNRLSVLIGSSYCDSSCCVAFIVPPPKLLLFPCSHNKVCGGSVSERT